MAKGILYLDEENKFVIAGIEAGSETVYTVQEIYSGIKDRLQLSPHIELDAIITASGLDEFESGTFTGVVAKMQDNWKLQSVTPVSAHRFRITQGLFLDNTTGVDPLAAVTDITYSIAEQTVSALLSGGGGSGSSSQGNRSMDK